MSSGVYFVPIKQDLSWGGSNIVFRITVLGNSDHMVRHSHEVLDACCLFVLLWIWILFDCPCIILGFFFCFVFVCTLG